MSIHSDTLKDSAFLDNLMGDGVGVIPTDTVYGLVARIDSPKAIEKLYQVKSRAAAPGTIIAASVNDLEKIGFSKHQLSTVASYWPAPLSVVLDASHVPNYVKHVRTDLPVRIPDVPALRTLLKKTGPLMTTSANAPGEPTSGTIDDAVNYFGDEVDFYVDGGDLRGNPPSTIIGFDPVGKIIVYREGAVPIHTLTRN